MHRVPQAESGQPTEVYLVAIAASATTASAAATTVAATAAAASSAAAATATTAATEAAAGAFFTRTGFIDGEGAAHEVGAVHLLNCLIGAFRHFDEGEAAAAARFAIGHDLGANDLTVSAERFEKVVRRGLEGKVADIKTLAHDPLSTRA